MKLRPTFMIRRRSVFACAAIIVFTVIGRAQTTTTQQISAFDYVPLEAGARQTYVAFFQKRDAVFPTKEVYSIVTKSVKKDGRDVFYFIEETKQQSTVQMLDVNMVGLGAYSRGIDGIYTYDCTWKQDLEKIPPKKPKLFLRSALTVGETIKVMNDGRTNAYEYTVLGFEDVRVPAGVFSRALKLGIKMIYADGHFEQSFAWFSVGTGLIKRIRSTGRTEELVSYEKPDSETAFITRSIEEWVGLKFMFLPQRKMFQKYGYQSLHKPNGMGKALPYEVYKNRIATVTKVFPFQHGHHVELVIDGTQEKIIGEAFHSNLRGIGPVDDLHNARVRYKGKTLWTQEILNTYNEELDEVGVSVITRYVAVKVLDVVPAWDSHQPIRFLLRTEAGFDVFIDVHMTHTNVPEQLRQYNDFSKVFSLHAPDQ
jgi:hypothetical protein